MDQGAIFLADYLIAAQASSFVSPESFKNEGDYRSSMILSYSGQIEKPAMREKNSLAPSTDSRARYLRFSTTRLDS
jgi:hypothetical protein